MKSILLFLILLFSILSSLQAGIIEDDQYYGTIRPIFENRCVACHSCFESPCQLKLTSYEGLMRGAHGSDVYEQRLGSPLEKHRLFKDAKTTKGWRDKGFWKIVEQDEKKVGLSAFDKLDLSLLWKFISLGKKNNDPKNIVKVNESKFGIRARREAESCIKDTKDFDSTLAKKSMLLRKLDRKNQMLGMPYGLPGLSDQYMSDLEDWIVEGAPGPSIFAKKIMSMSNNIEKVEAFEGFLNAAHLKNRWTAKYLYEHLFMTHIVFDDGVPEFYELVRSKTKKGEIQEIITDMPFDNPHMHRAYYRLRKITRTIVLKDHIVFHMSDAYLERLKELFINVDWGVENLEAVNYRSSNPFINFKNIPAKSRYKFMLDQAYMLAGLFTTGAACNGSYATYAVRDHFWVLFMDPDSDISVNDPNYFKDIEHLLRMPHDDKNLNWLYDSYREDTQRYENYHALKLKELRPEGLSYNDIWDGDEKNPSAFLTIYRHAKRTSVHYGAVGEMPRTKWVVDYPIFERIYYNLVAGFDVYSNLRHKFQTRVYMEQLRRESEDNFLSFLPITYRKNLRKSWYKENFSDKFDFFSRSLSKRFTLSDYYHEDGLILDHQYDRGFLNDAQFYRMNSVVNGTVDTLNNDNWRSFYETQKEKPIISKLQVNAHLSDVSSRTGNFNKYFKDVSVVRFTNDSGEQLYYSIIHNVAHKSMNVVFDEEETLMPENDTLNFVQNLFIPHPNIFFQVKFSEVKEFVKAIKMVTSEKGYGVLEKKYGIHRTDERFWGFYDDLNKHIKKVDPIAAGIIDLNLYGRHHELKED